MKYSPYSSATGMYAVGVQSVTVDGQQYQVPATNIDDSNAPIVDTGTTSLVIGEPAYSQIQALLCSVAAKQGVPLCFNDGTLNQDVCRAYKLSPGCRSRAAFWALHGF